MFELEIPWIPIVVFICVLVAFIVGIIKFADYLIPSECPNARLHKITVVRKTAHGTEKDTYYDYR